MRIVAPTKVVDKVALALAFWISLAFPRMIQGECCSAEGLVEYSNSVPLQILDSFLRNYVGPYS